MRAAEKGKTHYKKNSRYSVEETVCWEEGERLHGGRSLFIPDFEIVMILTFTNIEKALPSEGAASMIYGC